MRIYLDVYPIGILSLPGTVHNSDLHEITSVRIKVSPGSTVSSDFLYAFSKSHITKSMSKR